MENLSLQFCTRASQRSQKHLAPYIYDLACNIYSNYMKIPFCLILDMIPVKLRRIEEIFEFIGQISTKGKGIVEVKFKVPKVSK